MPLSWFGRGIFAFRTASQAQRLMHTITHAVYWRGESRGCERDMEKTVGKRHRRAKRTGRHSTPFIVSPADRMLDSQPYRCLCCSGQAKRPYDRANRERPLPTLLNAKDPRDYRKGLWLLYGEPQLAGLLRGRFLGGGCILNLHREFKRTGRRQPIIIGYDQLEHSRSVQIILSHRVVGAA